MAIIRIEFKHFWENSSSSEALYEFTHLNGSGSDLIDGCWDKSCRYQARKLVKIGVVKARKRARRALIRQGIVK